MRKHLPFQYMTAILLFLPAVLLFLPVLYYSLNTPFGLVDDYHIAPLDGRHFDSLERFLWWLDRDILIPPDQIRWRPFWEFYNSLVWKALGPIAWLHHLSRWVVHFTSVLIFTVAFLHIFPVRIGYYRSSLVVHLLPSVCLVYIWLFFPTQPAARLFPQEVLTVFFLSVSTLTIAFMLCTEGKDRKIYSTAFLYFFFYLAYIGLLLSKETNLGAALWILVFYHIMLFRGLEIRLNKHMYFLWILPSRLFLNRLLGGIPLILIFAYSLIMVHAASSVEHNIWKKYNSPHLDGKLIRENWSWLIDSIFQVDTSPIITVTTVLMLVLLLCVVALKFIKRQVSNEILFVLFLIGLFVSQCLILTISPSKALRYWYILVPVFSALLAVSIRFVMYFTLSSQFGNDSREENTGVSSQYWWGLPVAVVSFIIFFVGSNYYNFLIQTVVQYHRTTIESELLSEVTRLIDNKERVYIRSVNEPDKAINNYHKRYLPYYHGKRSNDVPLYTSNLDMESYYVVSGMRNAPPRSNMDIHFTVSFASTDFSIFLGNYYLVRYAYKVSDALQTEEPYYWLDAGAGLYDDGWIIYHWNGPKN